MTLAATLEIKANDEIAIGNSPRGFAKQLGPLPPGARVHERVRTNYQYDVIIVFAPSREILGAYLNMMRPKMKPTSALWIAWSTAKKTDVDESVVDELAVPLVGTRRCEIAAGWSALRLEHGTKRSATKPRRATAKRARRARV